MYIIGVDCAVSDVKTGLALMKLENDQLRLLQVKKGTKAQSTLQILDEWISGLTMQNQKVLVCFDAPLGWPSCFGENLYQHIAGDGIDCPPDLFFRRKTDNVVHQILGKRPLDVTANFIARTAFHALNIIRSLRTKFDMKLLWNKEQLNSVGFIEVYPAAWLISEGVNHQNYKNDATVRREIMKNLKTMVSIEPFEEEQLIESEHVLDSLLCCLNGIDFINQKCVTPVQMEIDQSVVLKEGWIWFKRVKT